MQSFWWSSFVLKKINIDSETQLHHGASKVERVPFTLSLSLTLKPLSQAYSQLAACEPNAVPLSHPAPTFVVKVAVKALTSL